jgi:hypothetical protein
VTKWRKALGVTQINDGTLRLKIAYSDEPFFKRAQQKAWTKARDPQRRAKIAAAKRGKPRPAHVIEAMAAARLGTKHTAQTRCRMSESHKRRGTRPPAAGQAWSAKEDEWLRTLGAGDVISLTGRTGRAVWARRRSLGLPDGRRSG